MLKRTIVTLVVGGLLVASAPAAGVPGFEGALPLKKENQARQDRVDQWYAPARLGVFYHWGLFTGGGDSSTDEPHPFCYNAIEEFEAAAKDPEVIASNLVVTAKRMGARYITMTLLHSCDRYTVLFPTKTPGFKMKTTKDYIGALGARCRQENIRLMLYLCSGPEHGFTKGGPWLDDALHDQQKYLGATKALLDEVATRYPNEIAGFWIDGSAYDLPEHMRHLFPECIIVHNNEEVFGNPNVDYGTTEFLSGTADPEYSRPTGLVRTHQRWNLLPPRRDYNEDIPVVGAWWYQTTSPAEDGYRNSPYAKNPTLVVKQMVSSLGIRRQWNYALGVGPMIDGKFAPSLQPMVETLHSFLAWASDSIYDTVGGESSALIPGWWNDGAYGAVTVSRKDPKVLYVHVTTPPKSDKLEVPNCGYRIASVVDLHSGAAISFTDTGVLILYTKDWADVDTFGDRVFKVTLAGTP